MTDKIKLLAVHQAIEKGKKHLLSKAVKGRWRGFPTMAGESDIWVSGFVLAHIFKLCEQDYHLEEVQNFILKSQQPTNGWSYSAIVPSDADSTAWCLMALQSNTKLTGIDLEKSKAFLWSHFIDGGISTYHTESGIREFIAAPNNEAIAGWTSAHPDVSIASVLADIENEKVPEILNRLIDQQTDDGFINSYWWRGSYYTTTLLLRALAILHKVLPKNQAKKIAEELVNRQLLDGGFELDANAIPDPFTTALALEAFCHLSYLGQEHEKSLCAKNLLESQKQDGSWEGGFILRIPAPNMLDPNQIDAWNTIHGGGNSYVKDQNGIFATTMACYALDCFRTSQLEKNKKSESNNSAL